MSITFQLPSCDHFVWLFSSQWIKQVIFVLLLSADSRKFSTFEIWLSFRWKLLTFSFGTERAWLDTFKKISKSCRSLIKKSNYLLKIWSSTWNKKVENPSAPTLHRPLNKAKMSGIKSDILIKYKRIKWTPSRNGFALSSQGDKEKISQNQEHF